MPGLGLGLSLKRSRRIITPGFNPLTLSPALYLDSSRDSTLYQVAGGSLATADGDPIGQWQDWTSNLNHLVQSSGTNKPTLRLTSKSVAFNGSSQYIDLSTNAFYFPSGSNFSVFAWVYASDYAQNYKKFISYNIPGSSGAWSIGTYSTTKKLYFESTGAFFNSTAALTNATWNHVGFVATGTSVQLYINGSADASGSRAVPGTTTGYKITLGAGSIDGSLRDYLNGRLRGVSVFPSALGASDIGKLFTYNPPS